MRYRPLGTTGIQISAIAFGAGPVSTLMVRQDSQHQRAVVEYALTVGVNWFDTAATYGDGQSERCLGAVLRELAPRFPNFHVATKVRLLPPDLKDIGGAVRRSVEGSLERLGVERVTLLQLHNSVTKDRGDEPTSIVPDDVLGPRGVLAAMRELQRAGIVQHLGLTGIGDPDSLRAVIASGAFATMQVPYHLLNPSAGCQAPADFQETNYGNVIAACGDAGMGVLAIRVLAGGALADNEPSPHTRRTPFFPLALYERDRARAAELRERIGDRRRLPVEAIRFVLSHSRISSALIGFAETWQIDEALAALDEDPDPINWDDVLYPGE